MNFTRGLWVVACLLSLLGACSKKEPSLAVGSKTAVEQAFLAEIAARHLERRLGIKVTRKFNWGETQAVHTGLVAGEIDVYPEDGCTAIVSVLRVDIETDRNVIFERVRSDYKDRYRAIWMDRLGYDDRFLVAARLGDRTKFNVTKLSNLAERRDGWRIGMDREFRTRRDGFALLDGKYRITLQTPPTAMDSPMFARALSEDILDLIIARASDPVWARDDLRVLEDDAHVLPPCEPSYVLRLDADQAYPGVRRALAELSGKFTLEAVRAANLKLTEGRASLESVAEEFLRDSGLWR